MRPAQPLHARHICAPQPAGGHETKTPAAATTRCVFRPHGQTRRHACRALRDRRARAGARRGCCCCALHIGRGINRSAYKGIKPGHALISASTGPGESGNTTIGADAQTRGTVSEDSDCMEGRRGSPSHSFSRCIFRVAQFSAALLAPWRPGAAGSLPIPLARHPLPDATSVTKRGQALRRISPQSA